MIAINALDNFKEKPVAIRDAIKLVEGAIFIFIIQNIDDYEDLSQLTIYNRWGDRVWQSEYLYDNANPWRGTNQNGTKLADGVYMYSLELVNASDDYEYSVNGTVTIMDAQ